LAGEGGEVMAEQIVAIEPALQSLKQLYIFRRPEGVFGFLRTHPFLVPLLLEAHGKIVQYFEPSRVVLEVVSDPEVQRLVKMFGYIVTTLTPEEAGEKLRQFDRGWFLLQVPRTGGLLNFDVEFRI
jgi:hypothetical protein